MDYEAALRTIFKRTDFERQPQPPYSERVYRLARMEELLAQFGNPHHAFSSVHVAGTKGKGSVTAMTEAILRAAGYRTGMYTSPHLHTFRERIQAEGQLISEADLARLVGRMEPVLEARPEVTVFEVITALAMCYYAERGVQVGVFEVGMGGRLDATNVLQPLVSVITSISLDHVKVLGDTLAAIAGEKAGIIKPGVPVVTAPQSHEALEVVRKTAVARGAPLVEVGHDWRWRTRGADADGQRLDIYRPGSEGTPEYTDLRIPLMGMHQLENASTAVAAVEVLRAGGMAVPEEAVRRGLETVRWPGRLEVLGRRPWVVVDGAHNVYSMERLLGAVGALIEHRRLILVVGIGVTHSPRDLLATLLPAAAKVVVTRSRHAKATPPEELASLARELGREAVVTHAVAEALPAALAEATPDDLVLTTGSLFVVAEAREAWAAMHGLPPPPSDPPGVY